jgi:hypothetical protein
VVTPVYDDQPSAAELRDELSPVSERYGAVKLGPATVVFDSEDPSRWIVSNAGVALSEMQ